MSIVGWDGEARALRGDIRLDGEDVDVVVGDGLVSFDEELTVSGSPIVRVGVLDPDRVLVESGLLDLRRDDADRLGREVELVVDRVAYWLRQVSKAGDMFTLVFEDRTVAKLRDQRGVQKVSARAAGGARGFIERLCAEAGVPAPVTREPLSRERAAVRRAGLGTRMSIERQQRERDQRREPGIADEGGGVTVKGIAADGDQRRNMNVALAEAVRHSPPQLALETMVALITVESTWRNTQGKGADSISFGLVQNIPGTSAGVDGTFTREQALDIPYTIRSVLLPPGPTSAGGLVKVAKDRPDLDHGTLADICVNGLGVGDPDYVPKVNAAVPEARRILAAYAGRGALTPGGTQVLIERTTRSPLTVERGETYWDAALRIAEARRARFFVVANQPYFLYDEAIMGSRPVATLADPGHPDADAELAAGVLEVGWEWAPHKQLRRVDLAVNATGRRMPPGSVVLLDETCGPGEGRWLVGEYRRDRFSEQAEVTLQKGRKPIQPTVTRERSATVGGDVLGQGEGGGVRVGRGGTTSPFGGQRTYPISGAYGTNRGDHIHSGLDVGVPRNTPCIAPFDGRITMATTSGFGDVGGMIHLQATAPVAGLRAGDKIGWGHVQGVDVNVGDLVSAGQRVGTSGWHHVHFVLLRSGGGGNGMDGNADPTAVLRALGGIP